MFKRLKPYFIKYKSYFIFGFLFVVGKNFFQSHGVPFMNEAIDSLSPALPGAASTIYQEIANAIFENWGIRILFVYILLFLGMELLQAVFLYAMRQTLIVASRKIEYDLRGDFFSHLQKLHVQFFQYTQTGDLMNRMISDLGNVRDVLGPGIMYTANTIVSFVFVVPMMLQISPKLTLVAFIPLLVLSFAINRLSKLIHVRSQKVQEKLSDISSMAQENFSGIRVIKSYVRELYEVSRFRTLSEEYVTLNMDMVRVRGIMMSSVILTIGLSVASLLWFGGRLIALHEITIGNFVAFNSYLAMLIWPIIALGWVLSIFQRGSASMIRLNAILETPPKIVDGANVRTVKELKGKIEFRNMNFSYQDKRPVLKNINLTVEPGTILGIVGQTGCGKSTLVNVISRLYEIPKDALFIDDIEIHEIPLKTLRSHIGMIPQDNFLFSDSILNNVVFGVGESSMERVEWASEVAQLKSNIMEFPEKYETIIGERGITLSGGQKQRLAIARAVICDPRILILDDSLSSVDTRTEDEILSRLRTLMRNRTCLIVSHRIQTVKFADSIITMSDGEIIERGTHDELVLLGGVYADMYQRQLLEEEMETLDQ